jgi:hypothetical protein
VFSASGLLLPQRVKCPRNRVNSTTCSRLLLQSLNAAEFTCVAEKPYHLMLVLNDGARK